MTTKKKIDQLRAELHRHNYRYYVLNAPEISDKEFDDMMRELQNLEQTHPEFQDTNSPTMRVGSDIQCFHWATLTLKEKYPIFMIGYKSL